MRKHIKHLIETLTPFPAQFEDGTFCDGVFFKRHISCSTCTQKTCQGNDNPIFICEKGFKRIIKRYDNDTLSFLGILTHNSKTKLPINLRKKIGDKAVDDAAVEAWINNIDQAISLVTSTIENKSREFLEGFHDITPTLSSIMRTCEAMIQQSPGAQFNDKFDNSGEHIKTIYKLSEVLGKHLQFMNYLSNPSSINYGDKKPTSVYKLLDKMTKIFTSEAKNKSLRLSLTKSNGDSYNKPKLYDSFSILIFVLIENAIKYSLKDQEITVDIADREFGGVCVDISSYGPIVPEEEKEKIFNKGYRYIPQIDEKDKIKGQGLGLYIGNSIAKAHDFEIEYISAGSTCIRNGVEIGENHFILDIPGS